MQTLLILVYLLITPLLFHFAICGTIQTRSDLDQGLLVISYDAFRPEYLNRNVTPNLNKFRNDGTSAPYMQNVFPTKTFVNHHSMATGFYAEEHGVTANAFFDSALGPLDYSYDLFHYDESIVPIWTANEKAGKHSGCMMWPGSNFQYQNTTCTFYMSFNESVPWFDRVDMAISWFTHEKTPANLVMFYIEEPDTHAHINGPDSEKITNMVAKLDNLTKYIQEQLMAHNLDQRINVIHLSDHGMSSVVPPNFIDLRQFTAAGAFKWYGSSPILQIVPTNPYQIDDIFTNLTKAANENGHFKVYNNENIPERWHINNSRRMGPILAVADMNYAFHDMIAMAEYYEKKFNVPFKNTTKYGVHGYDNAESDMHAIFMAKGPIFNKGKTIKPVQMINLYHLFCEILEIKCNKTNGSNRLEIWNDLLAKQSSKPISGNSAGRQKDDDTPTLVYMLLLLIPLLILMFGLIIYYRKCKELKNRTTNNCIRMEGESINYGSYRLASSISDDANSTDTYSNVGIPI